MWPISGHLNQWVAVKQIMSWGRRLSTIGTWPTGDIMASRNGNESGLFNRPVQAYTKNTGQLQCTHLNVT